ncbi:hypothetical protein MPH_13371 [Macrophomina phaseolina MS6]|uniref:Uncharacterized protein n=1 Tax=Macrophomina phaseolina (strain MS6) TaxID=1126212 RepID=K2RHK8_MACPH|nr:hypothetical protein MPH_13371 [Macrophomina phaseolina MS6]
MYPYQHQNDGARRLHCSHPFDSSTRHSIIAIPTQKPSSRNSGGFPPSNHLSSYKDGLPIGKTIVNGGRTHDFQPIYAAIEIQRKSLETLTQAVGHLSNDIKRLDRQLIIRGGTVPVAASPPNSAAPLQLGSPATFLQERSQTHPMYQIQHASHKGYHPLSHHPNNPISPVHASSRISPQEPLFHPPKSQRSKQNRNNGSTSVSNSTNIRHINSVDQHTDLYPGEFGRPKNVKPASLYSHIISTSMPMRHALGKVDEKGDYGTTVRLKEQQKDLIPVSTALDYPHSVEQPHFGAGRRTEFPNSSRPISQESRSSEGSDRGHRGQSLPADFRKFEASEQKVHKNHLQVAIKCNGNGDPRGDSTTRRSPGSTGSITKKSHTESRKAGGKQIRNANGVLLRKDGMPDMRSRRKKKGVLQNLVGGIVHDSVVEVENRRCNASLE